MKRSVIIARPLAVLALRDPVESTQAHLNRGREVKRESWNDVVWLFDEFVEELGHKNWECGAVSLRRHVLQDR